MMVYVCEEIGVSSMLLSDFTEGIGSTPQNYRALKRPARIELI